ncbi:HD domain-containing protein [Maridesulfovibrio hydrothermalis]|uniref:Metal-dependent phosphohydrolase HD sub domain protein n=1 Tax=Maridesulfovibrio hydrothermalis AM13 = DSM 14728 TaxID=1121451 RepID=L0RD89_9BACT|nr:HD domain-containing protein [Maridesulfovibrio hydrothermalis]CCO24719.1 Metal-dependent phosphohydrolase HD sub domain protein [Maridesulfovibrio hydrothermalis AM13 = DSM 14728]
MQDFKNIFHNFTAPYIQDASINKRSDFQLKLDHSLDVLENSIGLCRSLNLGTELTELAQIAALFHDTGRFPQYSQYGTFRDVDSCNHATLGVRHILKNKLLEQVPITSRKIVLGAIALHNRNRIPDNLPESIKLITQIVRDSDKIDIMKILLFHMEKVESGGTVTLNGLQEIPDKISPAILRSVEEKQQASYLDMQCLNDFRLLLLSWVYDFNFKWSRQQMLKCGYLDQIFSQLPKSPDITKLYKPITEQLNS